jgi:urease accessory protein UreH
VAFSEFQSSLEILSQWQTLVADRFILDLARIDYDALGYLKSFNACLSLYVLPGLPSLEPLLLQRINKALDPTKAILTGLTRLSFRGIMTRLLGKSVFELGETLQEIMAAVLEEPSPNLTALKRLML